jgi:small subunit ribosomal protein S17
MIAEKKKEETVRGKNTKVGRVVSNSMDKSVVVSVDRLVKHPLYKKYIKRTTKFMAHDPENECSVGDMVRFAESKPISKKKRWVVTGILEKAKV